MTNTTTPPRVSEQADERENKKLARILFGMVEGGGADRQTNIYADNYQAPDGDTYVYRAAEVMVEQDAEIGMLVSTINLLTEELCKARAAQQAAPEAPTLPLWRSVATLVHKVMKEVRSGHAISLCMEILDKLESAPEAPTCQWPTCQPVEVQQHAAKEVFDSLYGAPAVAAPEAPAEWTETKALVLRNEVAIILGCQDGRSAEEKAEAVISWIAKHGPAPEAPASEQQADDEESTEGDEESAEDGWRRLALQFDGHRLQALGHLRAMLQDPAKHTPVATEFLSAGPLSGEAVLASRIAALAHAATTASADPFYVPFNPNADCSPTLTQCPRCNNPSNACDRGRATTASNTDPVRLVADAVRSATKRLAERSAQPVGNMSSEFPATTASEDTAEFLTALGGAAKEVTDEWIAGFVRQHFGVYGATTASENRAAFRSHLQQCSAEAATWPDWKRVPVTTASASGRRKCQYPNCGCTSRALCNYNYDAPAPSREDAPLGVTDAMVEAYLSAQRAQVEHLDRHPWEGGDSRTACRAGLGAALAQQGAAQAAHAGADTGRSQAARDVLAERRRQVEAEGWAPGHDDKYTEELRWAAASYVIYSDPASIPAFWPWAPKWWKPRDRRSNLVRAGALLLAEIDRMDRAAMSAATEKEPK